MCRCIVCVMRAGPGGLAGSSVRMKLDREEAPCLYFLGVSFGCASSTCSIQNPVLTKPP